jgi:hypothetical protein
VSADLRPLVEAIAAAEGLPCSDEELQVLAATAATMRAHGARFAELMGGSTADDGELHGIREPGAPAAGPGGSA